MHPKNFLSSHLIGFFKNFIACYIFFGIFAKLTSYLGGFSRVGETVFCVLVFILSGLFGFLGELVSDG